MWRAQVYSIPIAKLLIASVTFVSYSKLLSVFPTPSNTTVWVIKSFINDECIFKFWTRFPSLNANLVISNTLSSELKFLLRPSSVLYIRILDLILVWLALLMISLILIILIGTSLAH